MKNKGAPIERPAVLSDREPAVAALPLEGAIRKDRGREKQKKR